MRRHNKNHLGPASPPADSSVPSIVPFPAIITIRPPPKHGLTLQSSTTSGALESHIVEVLALSSIGQPFLSYVQIVLERIISTFSPVPEEAPEHRQLSLKCSPLL